MKLIVKSLLGLLALCVTALAIADPPAQSGPRVLRYDYESAYSFSDFDSGLQVIFGANVLDFCNGIIDFEEFTYMDVMVDEDSIRILGPGYGEVYTTVWGFPEFDCERFSAESPLAVGMITLRLNDNDVYAWQENERSNKNSFSFRANGPVWGYTDGQKMRLHLVSHYVWGGFGNPDFEPRGFDSISLR